LNNDFLKKNKEILLLTVICIVAFIFRFYNLTLQGLWYDELYSVVLSAKHSLWKIVFECASDVHPPFFQICLYLWFKVFPSTEFFARLYPLTVGMTGVVALYFLGKELYNKNVGLAASLFASVNFFLVYYSQEVRSYSQNFTLTVISALLLVKLLKKPTVLKSIGYGLSVLALAYSHYFGLLMAGVQGLFVIFYLMFVKPDSFKDFLKLSIAGFIVVLGYALWVPVMLNQMKIKDFWIKPVKDLFFIDYIVNYFVNKPIALIISLLFVFSIAYLFKKENEEKLMCKWNSKISTYFIFFLVFLSYFIPYLKSLESSVLTPRNTIVTLPFLLLGASAGLNLIPFKKTKVAIALLLFFAMGFVTLNDSHGYLTKKKEKWREAVKFVIDNANPEKSIVLSEANYKQYSYFQYYFDHFGSNLKVLHPSKYQFLKLLADNNFNLEIWTLEGHWKPEVSKENLRILKAYFKVTKKFQRKTVKARKYVLKSEKYRQFLISMLPKKTDKPLKVEKIEVLPNVLCKNRKNKVGYKISVIANNLLDFENKKGNSFVQFAMKNTKTNKYYNAKNVAEFLGLDKDLAVSDKFLLFSFQTVTKADNRFVHTLRGFYPPSSLFLNIKENFAFEFKLIQRDLKESVTKSTPLVVTTNTLKWNLNFDFSKTVNENNKILLINNTAASFKVGGKCYSVENKIEKLLNSPDTDSLYNLMLKKDFTYIVIKNSSKFKSHIEKMLSLQLLTPIESKGEFHLYKLIKQDNISFAKFDNVIFNWSAKKDAKTISYFNKKVKAKNGLSLQLTDGLLMTGFKEKSYLVVAFANDKLWKKNSGYIDVDSGFVRFRVKGKSLTKNATVYPLITLYDKDGNVISTYGAEKLILENNYKYYDFSFGIKYYKETSPYLEIPLNCKKMAIAFYFYKEKGVLFIDELQVLKR